MLDHLLTNSRSNPSSPNYGKHLTRAEVIDLFAPGNYSVAKIKRWLASAGIDEGRVSQSDNKQVSFAYIAKQERRRRRTELLTRNLYGLPKQWIQFDAPAHELEELLRTTYHVFENVKTGVQNIACSQSVPSLPFFLGSSNVEKVPRPAQCVTPH